MRIWWWWRRETRVGSISWNPFPCIDTAQEDHKVCAMSFLLYICFIYVCVWIYGWFILVLVCHSILLVFNICEVHRHFKDSIFLIKETVMSVAWLSQDTLTSQVLVRLGIELVGPRLVWKTQYWADKSLDIFMWLCSNCFLGACWNIRSIE